MSLPPRIPVTEHQIDRVVTRFYDHVRAHPSLGPIFAAHVSYWPAHEVKVGLFWRNALLLQRCFDGNPMQAHHAAGNVKAAHFPIWLSLFDTVLEQELPPQLARAWSLLAHRIGRGLVSGLPGDRHGNVPCLRDARFRASLSETPVSSQARRPPSCHGG